MAQYPQLATTSSTTTTTTTDGTTGDDNPSTAPPISIFARSTQEALLSSALMSLTIKCRSILNHWLHQVGKVEAPTTTAEGSQLSTTATATASQNNLSTQPDQTNAAKEAAATTNSLSEPQKQDGANTASTSADAMEVDEQHSNNTADAVKKKNHQRTIVMTGAEKEFMFRLLQPGHGGIFKPDPTATLPEVNKDFGIFHNERHLVSTAISMVMYEQLVEHENVEKTSTMEQVRQDLIGLRVAIELEKPQFPDGDLWYRGFVVKVDRQVDEVDVHWKESLEEDLYWIRFDDGDNQELNPYELYCALLKYHELGEQNIELGEVDEETTARRGEKVCDAKLYAEQLRKYCRTVQKKVDKLEAEKKNKELEEKQKREEKARRAQEKARRAQEKQRQEEEEAERHEEMQLEEDETPAAATAAQPVDEEGKEEEKQGRSQGKSSGL